MTNPMIPSSTAQPTDPTTTIDAAYHSTEPCTLSAYLTQLHMPPWFVPFSMLHQTVSRTPTINYLISCQPAQILTACMCMPGTPVPIHKPHCCHALILPMPTCDYHLPMPLTPQTITILYMEHPLWLLWQHHPPTIDYQHLTNTAWLPSQPPPYPTPISSCVLLPSRLSCCLNKKPTQIQTH